MSTNVVSLLSKSETDLLEQMRYLVLPGKYLGGPMLKEYNAAYDCWKTVWEETLKALDGIQHLPSDQFTRQDKVGALFYRNECVGCCFFNLVHLGVPAFKDDSYFGIWTPKAINLLTQYGKNVIVCSNFTLHANWRKGRTTVNLKHLLTGLHLQYFLSTGVPAMTGAMRVDKGMNRASYIFGGEPLEVDVDSTHGDKVDLIGFFHEKISDCDDPLVNQWIKKIWRASQREDFSLREIAG